MRTPAPLLPVTRHRRLRYVAMPLASLVLVLGSGCASNPPEPLAHTPEYAPVRPAAVEDRRISSGAIYNGRQSDQWFGRGRHYRVGDIVTVILDEATQGERKASANLSRKGSNDVVTSGLTQKVTKFGGIFGGINLNDAEITSAGSGDKSQGATLKGEISVTVVDVLANGNLVLRGEKQMALSEGTEVIQVSGIIRPEDISPNNTVQSRRLANAQIAYRGTGDMANAAKAGWGTNALMKFWPF